MNKKFLHLILLCAVAAFSLTATDSFRFRGIGNFPNSYSSYANSLNLSRVVVGIYQPPGGFYHGYLQDGKAYKTLEPPGVLSSYLQGINDKGVAVGGYCLASCNPGSSQHGYTYSAGKYKTFDYPDTGYSIAPQGINNLGQIVGGYCPAATCPGGVLPSAYAFLLEKGVFTTLDFPTAIATQANAINDPGSIVGFYEDTATMLHGYQYRNGVFTQIDFPNSQWTIPLGINNAGTISGVYEDNNIVYHGFIYANGTFTQVDPPNSSSSNLGGINNKGEVTSSAIVSNVSTNYIGAPR